MSACWITLVAAACCLIGCRGQHSEKPPFHINPNMDDQERFDPQETNAFFGDRRAARPPVPATVARDSLRLTGAIAHGKEPDGTFFKNNPLPIDVALLKRGRERFNIICATCHDRSGSGRGMVATYPALGFPPIASFHDERIRNLPDGEIFNVMTHGVRNMPAYAHMIKIEDRWAIIAYVRALQRSQNADRGDVPHDVMTMLENR